MRKHLILLFVLLALLVFTARLVQLQLLRDEVNLGDDPSIRAQRLYPGRGHMFDRHGNLLVANQPAYDLMFIPQNIKNLDTLMLLELAEIDKQTLIDRIEKGWVYSPRLPSVLVSKMSKESYAKLQEKLWQFEGFFIQKVNLREYKTDAGAHVLGYISEVNDYEVSTNPQYISGEIIGRTGIERQYEEILRGQRGVRYLQKDRFNRDLGSYKQGAYDTIPVAGADLTLTLDKELQEYGERLMRGKRGGIVALEPKTGEILSIISGPTYNPNLLVGRDRSKNYNELYYDSIAKPTWDRSLLAQPSPGSPFKILNALAALQEGVITPENYVVCQNGFFVGKHKRGCHCGGGVRDLRLGVAKSCNAYFADTYRKIFSKYRKPGDGIDAWEKHIKSFGLGEFLGYDLPSGQPGRVPNRAYYDKVYGTDRWAPSFIISNAIGQGEVAATPIQLANMTAAIANKGYYFTPHVVKAINGVPVKDPQFTQRKNTTIEAKHFGPVIQAMADVYSPEGTARGILVPGISIAGKTGTVENFTRINGVRTQLTDHSVFIAFAPVEDPKIALAVYIEHGYYGARYAGHIASLMIEKYLKDSITRTDLETRMLTKTLEREYAKPISGAPFRINEYAW